VDRDPEYAGAKIDLFTSFIADELMPFIDRRYKDQQGPDEAPLLSGHQTGGTLPFTWVLNKPGIFGKDSRPVK